MAKLRRGGALAKEIRARRRAGGAALPSFAQPALVLASLVASAPLCVSALIFAAPAGAADLGYAPYVPPPPPQAYAAPPPAYGVDPRCRVVGMPQADLAGDTARFRPTAICQSRGLYTDSVIFPGPPVIYHPPPYAIPGYSSGYSW